MLSRTTRRLFSATVSATKDIKNPSILRGVDLNKILDSDVPKQTKAKARSPASKKAPKSTMITGPMLNNIYRDPTMNPRPTKAEITHANTLFNVSKKKLNWIVYDFENIPGEKERAEKEEAMDELDEEPQESASNEDLDFDEIPENERNRRLKISKKQETIDRQNSLPEVLLLGRCNVGKSSLINSIFNDLNSKAQEFNFAKVKNLPGFTQSLNFYNVGGLFRVVDSPGYGEKGKPWQGELTLEYIQNRRNLQKVYILISAKDGVKETDDQIIEFIMSHGIQFDFVITKIDKLMGKADRELYVKRLNDVLIPQLHIENPALQPNFHFVNNVTTFLGKRTGIDELRVNILKSAGYESVINLKPVFAASKNDRTQKSSRQVGDMDSRAKTTKK